LSISALTSHAGALSTKLEFNNFLSRIAIYSLVSSICSFSLSVSFSISKQFAVFTYTSTHALITQNAKFISVGFFETNSISSALTIHQIISKALVTTSAFLFLAYICNQIVLLGIILFSALRFLISLIMSIINFFCFSTSSSLGILTIHQLASIKSQENHSFEYISVDTKGIYGCHNLSKLFITKIIISFQNLEVSLVNLNSSI